MPSATPNKKRSSPLAGMIVITDLFFVAPLIWCEIGVLTVAYSILSTVCVMGSWFAFYLSAIDYAQKNRELIRRHYPGRFYRLLDCSPSHCMYFLSMDLDDAEFVFLKKRNRRLQIFFIVHFLICVSLMFSLSLSKVPIWLFQ